MKKRCFSALCALCLSASLIGTAAAETYSVTLTAEEAGGEVPSVLHIPAQTPAAPGTEPNRIVITSPLENAAVEISVSGDAKNADILLVSESGTYTAAEDIVKGGNTVATMIPGTSATLVILKKMPFTDVSRSAWYYGGTAYVYHNGLMSGTAAAKFSPDAAVSRSMIAAILWRQAGQPAAAGTTGFSDVPAGQFYTTAACWAAEQGIMTGSGKQFVPNGKVTREQLAVMLCRYAAWSGKNTSARADLSRFSDSAKVSAGARAAVAWAVSEGLLSGNAKGQLDPTGSVSRAQLAAILMRSGM